MQLTEHRVLTDFQVMMRDGVILIDLEELILIWAMIAIIAAGILVAILASVLV